MSYLLILGVTLIVLVVLIRLKVEFGLAILASAVILGLLAGLLP